MATANPQNLADYGLEPLDEEQEWLAVSAALEGLDIQLIRLPQPCTLAAIAEALADGCHILHFTGHGMFDGTSAMLMMADDDNNVRAVADTEFAEMLARQLADSAWASEEKLRLVFLASCETATRSPADAFRGCAPQLVTAGVPAVVAMQDLMPVEPARSFSRTFYRRLLEHGVVDLAANQARAQLLSAGQPGATIPVLFLRLANGELLGRRGQILGDEAASFWRTLLDNIYDGECTPFLGRGVTRDLFPSGEELARRLTEEYNYPFLDQDNLPRVAQFVGTVDNRNLRKKLIAALVDGFKTRMALAPDRADRRKTLSAIIEESGWSTNVHTVLETEIHHQLADLDLPLYITTNFDNFMTLALHAAGRQPRRVAIDWHAGAQRDAARPHYDLTPPPGVDEPVVLHLFGSDEDLLSMVLTEDDYLDYLARIAQDYEYLLPTSVNEALASTTLLFLGYRLEDIDLKVILRGLLTNLDLERWGMLHVAVQIESSVVDKDKQEEVTRYFQRYFGNSKIDVDRGSTQQFVADLHSLLAGGTEWLSAKHLLPAHRLHPDSIQASIRTLGLTPSRATNSASFWTRRRKSPIDIVGHRAACVCSSTHRPVPARRRFCRPRSSPSWRHARRFDRCRLVG